MADLQKAARALERRGYDVRTFSTAAEAAAYLDGQIDGKTVGIGGSMTVKQLGVADRLAGHNTVIWHWSGGDRDEAARAQVYCTSVNALAETGEMVSIDGTGNRLAGMLFGHEKVYFVVGKNKLTGSFEEAVSRARNAAAPRRAAQMGRKVPCAAGADRCCDCRSPERICGALLTLWQPMTGMAAEVVLIDQELGL